MDLRLDLPDEVVEALGEDPAREALEGVLLLLVGEGRMALDRAGDLLGLEGRAAAESWYAGRAKTRRELSGRNDVFEAEKPVFLDGLTQEEIERMDRFLDITPAERGSGLSDVSINHDEHLYGND